MAPEGERSPQWNRFAAGLREVCRRAKMDNP